MLTTLHGNGDPWATAMDSILSGLMVLSLEIWSLQWLAHMAAATSHVYRVKEPLEPPSFGDTGLGFLIPSPYGLLDTPDMLQQP